MSLAQIVEFVLLCIQVPDGEPKHHAGDASQNTHDAVIPYQQWVSGKCWEEMLIPSHDVVVELVRTHERLAKSRGDS
jgi:hypothetical protein